MGERGPELNEEDRGRGTTSGEDWREAAMALTMSGLCGRDWIELGVKGICTEERRVLARSMWMF